MKNYLHNSFFSPPAIVWRQVKPCISYYSPTIGALWNKFARRSFLVVRLSLDWERILSLLLAREWNTYFSIKN